MADATTERVLLFSQERDVTEQDLVLQAQTGDGAAFDLLIQRHRPACLRKAKAILHNSADAEDEVQNAILLAFVHLGKFEFRSSFGTWLTRIVSNRCLMRLRHGRVLPLSSIETLNPISHPHAPKCELRSAEPTPEEILHRKQLADVIEGKSRALPCFLRTVLTSYIECPRSADVTCRLQISVSAAKSRLHRARRELRDRVEPQFRTVYSSSRFRLPARG